MKNNGCRHLLIPHGDIDRREGQWDSDDPLIVEAVREAVEKPYAKATARVLTPEYLMAIMIQTGRPTDRERLLRFLEEAEVSSELLDRILTKHGLKTAFENMRRSWHGD